MSDNPLRDVAEPDTTVSLVGDVLAYLAEQAESSADMWLRNCGGGAPLTPRGAAGHAVLLGMLRKTLDQAVSDMRHD